MAKATLTATVLETGDAQRWEQLAQAHGTLFDSTRWTDLFGPNLRRLGLYDRGGTLRGGFCVYEQRRLGLRILRNPPFTRQIGPFYAPKASNPSAIVSEMRGVVEAMAKYLDEEKAAVLSLGLSLGIDDGLPFRWRGYKVIPHYTYRLDLNQSEDALFSALAKEKRNDIRKAQQDGIEVLKANDTRSMRELVTHSFARQKKALPHGALATILNAFAPGSSAYCYVAHDQQRPVAGVYIVHDAHCAYYLLGGYAQGAHHGAGAYAMLQAIHHAKALGLATFDFEGSVIQAIERYFRAFGGTLTPVLGVHKAWFPIECALKLRRREIF